ncbi:MAG: ABC transporter ATP-binding protein/permease [Rickettsiales bacterium]|jgi:subfamily B ATP-binding cassette protein MsbA|nr:ABC transporter ATP-binding protein/permease [Rickettsiales bacterium]
MSLPTKSSSLIRRLLGEHIKPYRGKVVFAMLCMLVVAGATATNAWMMQPALDQIFIAKNRDMLLIIPLAVFCVGVMGAAANYGNLVTMRYVGQRLVADIQTRLFSHLMRADLSLFHHESAGRLISRFTNDINMMRSAFTTALTSLVKESVCLIFLVGVMVYQNATLALVAMPIFLIAVLPIIKLGKSLRKISDKTQAELGEFTATLEEIFSGVRTVKSYNRESFETSRAGGIIESLFKLYYKAARRGAFSTPMMEMISGASIALVIWYGGRQVMDGVITPGAFFSFIAAFLMAYRPVRAMTGLNAVMQEGLAAASRLFAVLDTPPAITDAKDAKPLAINGGEVCFKHVSFAYSGGHGVHDINLHVPAGKTVALVGLSGGGKSTLVNLLLRFYDVDAGRITIDGEDIRSVTLHSLREAIALVPQESMLFDDTVRANIAYGREGATEEEIISAAKHASAHDFIMSLPEGYGTMIGSHGVRLSGGQRQRLAIARAILKNAPILLLDEATSSLDNESERAIQDALGSLMKGRTTLVIAHRLSTIVSADLIYVLEHGRILESGSHASLLAGKGKYYQLYGEQFTKAAS